ncbi:Pancreatic triacylglycerol lipase like protein [Argiope bruennichi]|uniref:Pancreatic triacylglycerol lipase like protein n=1 Tax=Argiope bruennichi TaxID=94029 RepID=A0A8T0FDQ8_ARGBR|nr:Pancreatic triacylglycerol lipase like protein [Argiope bruennichi]
MVRLETGVFFLLLLSTCVRGACVGDARNTTCRHVLRKRSLLFVEKTACYHDLGCFSNGPPFYHPVYRPLSLPPQPPEVVQTTFLLYTRRNKHRPIFLTRRNVKKSTFDPSSLTRIIIHGFNDNQALTSWFQRLKDVILDRAEENVLIVDWSGSNRLPYTIAVANSRLVGAQIAHFITYLYKTVGTRPESFHLIGHSLGAHIAGYAGERLHKLGRISGLDPAGPFFRNVPEIVRLDPSDAVFVDVIHSNPAPSVLRGFGSPEDSGDLDFFPGGGDPPGCEKTFARSLAEDLPTEALGNLVACQHLRAYEFFIYSFNPNGCFVGVECSSWADFLDGHCNCGHEGEKCAIMGMFSPTYAFPSGKHYRDRRMYLKVGPERPFCVHQYQLIVHIHSFPGHYLTYGLESAQVDVTVYGKLEKMKGKLHVNVNLAKTNQVNKFLLSTDRPLGEPLSAALAFEYDPQRVDQYKKKSNFFIEKIEINYLYPLPKELVSTALCRSSEKVNVHEGKVFVFTPNTCY